MCVVDDFNLFLLFDFTLFWFDFTFSIRTYTKEYIFLILNAALELYTFMLNIKNSVFKEAHYEITERICLGMCEILNNYFVLVKLSLNEII